ncbi:Sjogren's syndrome/scleroderma autoantigen 1 family protein [Halobacterium wangiae]|uniref:Sjogren's syndrome/scleroderma autoantigen 1 family protein n=1 Tax=Halobacterium wangiae TaxID=2902623 RepID=UPI001E41B168|nr:Sjogren's syndrome/scleroderma autoantigen 1 family protein [Halobacterium wangiae]
MSDTDGGFDEEAVREELREKYEDEREDREATARMSELLLQGATMTSEHCDRCGSPIFRYDGESFCPNCQHEAEQAQAREAADSPKQNARTEQPADTQTADAGTADETATESQPDPPAAAQTGGRRAPPSKSGGPHAPGSRDQQRSRDAVAERTQAPQSLPERSGGAAPSGEAADALESSIAALARRAAAADDPRTAREYLEAAREAAEALAALR